MGGSLCSQSRMWSKCREEKGHLQRLSQRVLGVCTERRRARSRASEDIKIGDPLTSCNVCSESEDRSTPISGAEWIKWSLDNDVQRQWQRGWGRDMLP